MVNGTQDRRARIGGMTGDSPPDISAMLASWKDGDTASLDRLVQVVYPELRRIAHRQLRRRRRRGDSLVSAALANETYLRLVQARGIACENRAHFLALCGQVMRRILVDHARRRRAAKRGGDAVSMAVDDLPARAPAHDIDVLALNEALVALARIDGRKSRVVELRYFAGLTIEETADVLGLSVGTAKRDLRLARAWLLVQLADT
jgi:RNA polymerase sigma factor (TIGR02999 family)